MSSSANIDAITKSWRAANYLSAAMLYLKDNPLLTEALAAHHLKSPVLGHWGTAPGVNAIYVHASDLSRRHNAPMRLIVGTGHAGTSMLANLFLEGTLEKQYSRYTQDLSGLKNLLSDFGTAEGINTEISAKYPGMIYAGGELGGALAFAQGTSFNDSNNISICVIGDGELETSLTQAAWQGFQFLSAVKDGSVLPVINANGNKMGSRSLFSIKSKKQQTDFFHGHGLKPIFAGTNHLDIANAFDAAYSDLLALKQENHQVRQPVIVLETPKGWTAPEKMGGKDFEGSHASHKPVIRGAWEKPGNIAEVEQWLRSYKPEELFDKTGKPVVEVTSVYPPEKMAFGNQDSKHLPLSVVGADEIKVAGAGSSIEVLEASLSAIVKKHADILIFSPDELSSNKLSRLVTGQGLRTIGAAGTVDGQTIEILNEHMCFAWSQGYAMSGGKSVFVSYEAFAPLVDSMATQYLKFLNDRTGLPNRPDRPSVNVILTSLGWHNCPTHQNPGFIDHLFGHEDPRVRIYTPSTLQKAGEQLRAMLNDVNGLNVMALGKHALPLTFLAAASTPVHHNFSSWNILSADAPHAHDIALVGIGDCMVEELLHAKQLIQDTCDATVQVVAVDELTLLDKRTHPDRQAFESNLRNALSRVWAYLGHPKTIKGYLWDVGASPQTNAVLGYKDKGEAEAGLDRFAENRASRYDVAQEAIARLNAAPGVVAYKNVQVTSYQHKRRLI